MKIKSILLTYTLFTFGVMHIFGQSKNDYYQAKDFTDSVFTSGIEGPACDKQGYLYVVNFEKKGTIGRIDLQGKSSLFVDLPVKSVGNGIRFGARGDMFVADYTSHNILKIDHATRKITIYAHDSTMNQPNDIAISRSGIIFASDPNWKNSTGNIWKIGTDGKLILLEKNMGTTNGIEVAPGDSILYVNESIQRKVWKYKLEKNGAISQKTLFFTFDDFGMDGMRCDIKGNLYVTRHGKGTVAILSANGKLIREVVMKGKKPSNIAFGGKDGKTCFVTLQDRGRVETFRTEIQGREFHQFSK